MHQSVTYIAFQTFFLQFLEGLNIENKKIVSEKCLNIVIGNFLVLSHKSQSMCQTPLEPIYLFAKNKYKTRVNFVFKKSRQKRVNCDKSYDNSRRN